MTTRSQCRTKRLPISAAFVAVLFAFALPSLVRAQAKVGTTGASFLELGVSARAMGMAEAYIASVEDISGTYYNPAALSRLQGGEAMLSYVSLPADVNYGFAAAGLPLETIGGVLGFAAYGVNSGDIVKRTYENPTGNGQTFSSNDLAIGISYGRYLTERFSVGVTMRYISLSADETNTSGWSADIGTLYDTGYRGFKIGMVITNFGPDLRYIKKDFPLPINFKFGTTLNLVESPSKDNIVTASFEGAHPADNLEKYNVGLEYSYKSRYMLRVGERFNYDLDGLTFGGGLRIPFGEQSEIRLDYAYQDMGILSEVHRFTFGVSF